MRTTSSHWYGSSTTWSSVVGCSVHRARPRRMLCLPTWARPPTHQPAHGLGRRRIAGQVLFQFALGILRPGRLAAEESPGSVQDRPEHQQNHQPEDAKHEPPAAGIEEITYTRRKCFG